ncbi:MAG: GGDEF domain-containing protein [Tissierellia bacterium]|nr:GGDEF domain-containing protein [Tissierellia bacterium]
MISRVLNNIKSIVWPDRQIIDEIFLININRVFYLSIVSIIIRLFSIVTFLNKVPTEYNNDNIWRAGLVLTHSIYLVLLIVLAILSYKQRNDTQVSMMTIGTQYIAIMLILLIGVVITSIDQLVTPSTTPFTIACIAIGAIFIIKPLHSLLMFLIAYIMFYFAMGIVLTDLSILLSNRVNGLTSVSLGFFLSFILWKSNVTNLQLKERILLQQKELEDKNKELQHIATYDSLTELVNRRCFEEQVSNVMLSIERHGGEACLLLIDVDDFKTINDKYGHPIGDKVLQRLASIMKSQLRRIDIVSRIGGDEFAIILVNTDIKAAKLVGEKLKNSIEKDTLIIDEQEINMTVCIGITSIDNKTDSYEEAYKYADKALYMAKTMGKNQVGILLKELTPHIEY